MTTTYNESGIIIIMQCEHCGTRGTFTVLLDCANTTRIGEFGLGRATTRWYVVQCQKCSKPMFMQSYDAYDPTENETIGPKTDILYPAEIAPLTNLPAEIEQRYREALKVRTISPSSCAVQIRKTLEAICKHENATGRVLASKLRYLATTGRIPQTLADVALHLKQLGNLGAHFEEDEVTKEDVPIILDFVVAP